jgi:hypothetical protein
MESLEGLLVLFQLLFVVLMTWRVLVCLAPSSILAYCLVHFALFLNEMQGFGFALIGIIPGLIWESHAVKLKEPERTFPLMKNYIAAALCLFSSSFWGFLSASSLKYQYNGFFVLVSTIGIWSWWGIYQKTVPRLRIIYCSAICVTTYIITTASINRLL